MIIKNINNLVTNASRLIEIIVLFCFALTLVHFIWWLFSPNADDINIDNDFNRSASNIYIQNTNINQFNDIAKAIINRYPFGLVIATPKKTEIVADSIKLTGIYYKTASNASIAFFEINKKPIIAKNGDNLIPGTVVKAIESTMVLLQNDKEVIATLTSGETAANSVPTQNNSNNNNQYNDINTNQYNNNQNQYNQSNDSQSMDEFRANRQKLIEKLSKKNQENNK